ncbi:MAG: ATP-grasp domain-containing protein [Deltaproteobacteria bacterium]|nr:ATP-grasp domain-containing protein [Deltaproteobacteria bacterium]
MKRILIANRGEIACRVARSAHAAGYETVAVFSDADRGARHTQVADVAVHIGPSVASSSYLDVSRLLEAAAKTGCDAVHPGYGFLAENAGFAEACAQAGLTFIGPPPSAIRAMGNKRQAKILMAEAGVPVVPGYSGGAQDVEVLLAEARRLGPPLMIKASAGGGGRGLRRVDDLEQVEAALVAARSEAESAFGDGELILERRLITPRHVEIQVFADTHGNVIHLGERDCSVQRRHQKVVEEAPSPAVQADLRARMGAAAVAAARAIGYVGAGTVEMLLDETWGAFYFMEMNTRLQVEHPVTELVTGLDLVAWQLDVAAGRPLPMTQDDLRMDGHAIEVRLYAEDPYNGFLPQVGRVGRLIWPEGVRVDHGLVEGQAITAFYDAMVAKLVAHGRDREEARRRLVRALGETVVGGLVTNQAYLMQILAHPVFAAGAATTAFVAEHMAERGAPAPDASQWALAAALFVGRAGVDHWRSTGVSVSPVRLACGEVDARFSVVATTEGYAVARDGATTQLAIQRDDEVVRYEVDGVVRRAHALWSDDTLELFEGGARLVFERRPHSDKARVDEGADHVKAPMAGRVISVSAARGAAVRKGQLLVVLEAMKMQLELCAARDGVVAAVHVQAGDQVDNKQTLVDLEGES